MNCQNTIENDFILCISPFQHIISIARRKIGIDTQALRLEKFSLPRRSSFHRGLGRPPRSVKMEGAHKPHRAPHAGAKAERKKAMKNGETAQKGKNPKAFIMSGSRRLEKQARRSAEVQ